MVRRAIGPLTTLAVVGLALPALAQEASLPGGASTLNETHGALTVICAIGTQAESRPVKYVLCPRSSCTLRPASARLPLSWRARGRRAGHTRSSLWSRPRLGRYLSDR